MNKTIFYLGYIIIIILKVLWKVLVDSARQIKLELNIYLIIYIYIYIYKVTILNSKNQIDYWKKTLSRRYS